MSTTPIILTAALGVALLAVIAAATWYLVIWIRDLRRARAAELAAAQAQHARSEQILHGTVQKLRRAYIVGGMDPDIVNEHIYRHRPAHDGQPQYGTGIHQALESFDRGEDLR